MHFINSASSDQFAQWWWWDGVMYKETNTILKTKRIRLFVLIINCTIIMRNVYAVSNRIWCNKQPRHTTTEKHDNNGKDGYFRFDYDNIISYRYIFSITWPKKGVSWTHTAPYIEMKIKGNRKDQQHVNNTSTRPTNNYMYSMPMSSLVWWW